MNLIKWVLGVGLAVGVIVGVGLAARGALQAREAQRIAIHDPGGVQEAGFVDIGGTPQWVQIRGRRRANPVILFVHGGPGFAMSPFVPVFQPWEGDFTVVQWDQRDAGHTFSHNGPQAISLDQVAGDGIAVAEDVHRRLPGAPLILLGHSWGSAVGLAMLKKRPDLFAAYVGVGQLSGRSAQEALAYQRVLARLVAAGEAKGARELRAAGPPPYKDLAALLVERKWMAAVDTPAERALFAKMTPMLVTAPGMSLKDDLDYLSAPKVAQAQVFDALAGFDADRYGRAFAAPIFVIAGDQDLNTPAEPTASWLSRVQAPSKAMIILKGGGHDAVLTMPDAVLGVLRNQVRPQVEGR